MKIFLLVVIAVCVICASLRHVIQKSIEAPSEPNANKNRILQSEHEVANKPSKVLPSTPSSSPDVSQSEQSNHLVLKKIHDASVTYDPQQLPMIAEFLLHKNPEVRKAALDGMIVLGDSAAAPLLRQAAASAPTPREAMDLEEAADYMELPPASLRQKP